VFKNSVQRLTIATLAANIEAANIGINIFRKILPLRPEPLNALEFNHRLLLTTDGDALDIVLMFEYEDNGSKYQEA
jgi:hypothetical protein